MQLTTAVQECLCCLLCYYPDTEGAAQAKLAVPVKFYDKYYRDLVEKALAYREQFSEPPGEHTYDLIEDLIAAKPDHKRAYESIFQSMEMTKAGINVEYITQQAGAFARYQSLRRGLGEAIDLMERDDATSVNEAETVLRDCLDESVKTFEAGVSTHDPAGLLGFITGDEEEAMPTGIPCLDRYGMGPKRKELHTLIASSGKGKSWWLLHLAKMAMMTRHRVLYLSLELSEEQITQRLVQMLCSVTMTKDPVRFGRFEVDELGRFIDFDHEEVEGLSHLRDRNLSSKLRTQLANLKRRPPLRIKEYPPGELSVGDIDAYLDALEGATGFIPDLLVVDYADELATRAESLRTDLGLIYRGLRAIAVRRKIAVATASQCNRVGDGVKVITRRHIAEDWSKIARSDTVLTYNQSTTEEELGLARIYVDKVRSTTNRGRTAIISQAYNAGQFVVDSALMVPTYWESIEEEPGDDGDDQ